MTSSAMCYRCFRKFAQKFGLCKACGRALGIEMQSRAQIERQRLEARQALQRQPVKRAAPIPQPNRSIVLEGWEYEIQFDGRQPLIGVRWA